MLPQLLATVEDVDAPTAASGLHVLLVVVVLVVVAFLVGYLLWRRSGR